MSGQVGSAPVSRRFLTPGVLALMCLAGFGAAAALYRFAAGLGSATNLSNEYPWGIWIAVDVAGGVALAAGGFTTAALVHIFQRHRYEVVVRPALLTAMLGYTFVVLGLLADLGRYYNLWHPMLPTMWQGNSVMFEVGMCVMIYLNVLYFEFAPLLCERFVGRVALPGPLGRFNSAVDWALRLLQGIASRVMFLFIIAGVVLSCMHQSSLGALMLVAPYKMNPLWYTPVLPVLFLLSAIAVGLPMVAFESLWASWAFGRKPEMKTLAPLCRLTALLLGVYGAAKIADLVVREAYVHLFSGGPAAHLYELEIVGGILLPLAMLLSRRVHQSPLLLFTASALVVLGVLLNRINVFLVAYNPPFRTTRYFPSALEIAVTVGLLSGLILMYRVFVMIFPILRSEEEDAESLAMSHNEVKQGMTLCPKQAVRAAREVIRSPNALLGGVAAFLATLLLSIGSAAQQQMPGTAEVAGECSSCHSSANPSRADLYQSPCRRPEAPSAPLADRSEDAPDVFILDRLSSIYVPVVFPHKLHASMESMADGCAICHHHDEPGKTRACHECHNGTASAANLRQPGLKGAYHRQCLGCHREWSHDTDCVVCHAKRVPGKAPEVKDSTDIMGHLHPNVAAPEKKVYDTPELEQGTKVTFLHKEHVSLFGRKCVDCHNKENCSNCHDAAVSQEKRVRQDPHQDCIKCHDVAGECTQCHMKEESTGFNHARRSGFALKPYHQGIACGKCHTGEDFTGLKRDCRACHAADWFPSTFDHAKTGLTLDAKHADTSCNGCHPGGLGKPTNCTVCHEGDLKYPEKSPGKLPTIERAVSLSPG